MFLLVLYFFNFNLSAIVYKYCNHYIRKLLITVNILVELLTGHSDKYLRATIYLHYVILLFFHDTNLILIYLSDTRI